MSGSGKFAATAVVVVLVAAACAGAPHAPPPRTSFTDSPGAPDASSIGASDQPRTQATGPTKTGAMPPGVAAPPLSSASPAVSGSPVEVAYRLERRTSDAATAGFEATAEATLADPRGWGRAGFRLVRRPTAAFVVVLAESSQVDALCLPYDTYGLYSCQNGPVVALNADRWRTATPKWTGSLEDYRRYLVGHEVGHLLGLHHPAVPCPGPGRPAPLMGQQSTELNGCRPNPWPLEAEVQEARRRPAELAPPYRP